VTISETPTAEPTPTETVEPTPTETVEPTPTLEPTPTETPTTPPTVKVPRINPWSYVGIMHGDFVLPTKDGCGIPLSTQTGEATAVAEDSITVRSLDGFEKVYAIAESTRTVAGRRGNSEVRQADQVLVAAAGTTVEGETATAAYIYDLTRPSKSFWKAPKYRWPHFPGTDKWRTPTPCPTPPQTPTPTPTPTDTPTLPPTETPTGTPTVTPTDVPPTPEPTPTVTETTTPDPTPTP
jgi:type VI secretion system secreted protein VgrG